MVSWSTARTHTRACFRQRGGQFEKAFWWFLFVENETVHRILQTQTCAHYYCCCVRTTVNTTAIPLTGQFATDTDRWLLTVVMRCQRDTTYAVATRAAKCNNFTRGEGRRTALTQPQPQGPPATIDGESSHTHDAALQSKRQTHDAAPPPAVVLRWRRLCDDHGGCCLCARTNYCCCTIRLVICYSAHAGLPSCPRLSNCFFLVPLVFCFYSFGHRHS